MNPDEHRNAPLHLRVPGTRVHPPAASVSIRVHPWLDRVFWVQKFDNYRTCRTPTLRKLKIPRTMIADGSEPVIESRRVPNC